VKNSPRLFTSIQAVFKYLFSSSSCLFSTCPLIGRCRAFESTKLYREVKLRGAIVQNKQLLLLPGEEIVDQVPSLALLF